MKAVETSAGVFTLHRSFSQPTKGTAMAAPMKPMEVRELVSSRDQPKLSSSLSASTGTM